MSRLIVRVLLPRLGIALLVVVLRPPTVLAHLGGEPFIHVPLTDVPPGVPFPVIAADLGQDATVTFELLAPEGVVHLGDAVAGADGHFETTLTLPEATPDGYVQLQARSSDGSQATTWIHVLAGATAPAPAGADSFELVPLAAGALAIAALGVLVVRTRRSAGSSASR